MKKIVIGLMCFLTAFTAQAVEDDDKPIRVDQLPSKAQTFIRENFSGLKIALAKMESDFFDKSYEVIFVNGNKVEFYRDGRWKEIECKYDEVPLSAVPDFIRKYVAEHHAGLKVWKLEYVEEEKCYEVKLSNRWELKFDTRGNLIDLDRD